MKQTRNLAFLSILAAALLSGVACKEKGPMEKAGESLDRAAEKTADMAEDGVKAVGDAAEKVGDKVKDATN